jgi:SAM-dependent methyltransferase
MVRGVDGDRFGAAVDDYVAHRKGFPPETLDHLAGFGFGRSGHRVLDVGTGTGTLARQFAAAGCVATGLDVDERMLGGARRMAAADGVEVDWVCAPAEDTGLDAGCFDGVVSGQAWHWFDGHAAAAEARRLLVPGGLLAVCAFDWLPLPDTVPGVSEALVEVHNPAWDLGGIRQYETEVSAQFAGAGFELVGRFEVDVDVVYDTVSWCRRMAGSAGIVNLAPDRRAAFADELASVLAERFPGDEVVTPHRLQGFVARRP